MTTRIGTSGQRQERWRCSRAFTLVEVLVTAALVGVVTLSLFACFTSGFGIVQSSRENLRATQILLQRMEAVRLFTWTQMLDTTNYLKPSFTEYYDPLGATNNMGGALYQGYVSTSIPSDLPAAYRTNMRTITVTLFWTNYIGGQATLHTRQMQTRVARRGMQNYLFGLP